MSHPLFDRSPDLKRLRDEGFNLEVRNSYLLAHDVPYVNSQGHIKRGILASELSLAGDVTTRPSSHVAYFSGDHPCHRDGREITEIKNSSPNTRVDEGLVLHHLFSSKPPRGYYEDYYEKITAYINIISNPARSIDPALTARTFQIVEGDIDDTFNYLDTASSRVGITAISSKLRLSKIAIIGLGGTGSYVLDLVAKTLVKEIHLFDADIYLQHNAFRAPGATSIEDLRRRIPKVTYYREIYSRMRKNIVEHPYFIDETNVDQLRTMDFVFICMDQGKAKRVLIQKLEEFDIPFVDVGMGVLENDGALLGVLRVTTSSKVKREHVIHKNRIPMGGDGGADDYSSNIQIADLNALNATLAVIKWKKMFGFYRDLENEHFTTYTIDGNALTNEDHP